MAAGGGPWTLQPPTAGPACGGPNHPMRVLWMLAGLFGMLLVAVARAVMG
jgi:hypothetical protein